MVTVKINGLCPTPWSALLTLYRWQLLNLLLPLLGEAGFVLEVIC